MSVKKQVSETFVFQPFEDLKRIIENKGIIMHCKAPAAKKEQPVNDEELFANAMREVREIKEFRSIPVRPKKAVVAPKKSSSDKEALTVLEEIIDGRRSVNLPDTQEYVEWVNQDYKRNIVKKLHEGRFAVQDYLDLHGLCLEEAESSVEQFIKESLTKGHRCIRIIHGRGLRSPRGPVLKEALIKWLSVRYRKHIIAFVSARQCDGGLGALYILLR
ncbi:MAG: Smr/MutS family protein [Nitrospirota bacterium]|nr:Smr/MutS family protein [Nitrospirota bacterium]